MEFLFFLVSVAALVVGICVCNEFRRIAEAKGFPGSKYFWWCFFLGFIGYLMVLALPDRVGAQAATLPDELPDL